VELTLAFRFTKRQVVGVKPSVPWQRVLERCKRAGERFEGEDLSTWKVRAIPLHRLSNAGADIKDRAGSAIASLLYAKRGRS
jgi:hypothetical protein